MADLSTEYLGLKLNNPLVVGASGLTADLNTIKRLEDAGAGAIVCKSLFEEQIQLKAMQIEKELHQYDDLYGEMVTVFPQLKEYGPGEHLYWVKQAKDQAGIPVIASLNAVSEPVWFDYARQLAETGVDALELNLSYAGADPTKSPAEIEAEQIRICRRIKAELNIPVSVKLAPYYTNTMYHVRRLAETGLDGFVLFNRYFQADIDIQKEANRFPLSFSTSVENRLSLKYVGLLFAKVSGSLCAATGIKDGEDLVKLMLAGADAVQLVSTLYKNGAGQLRSMLTFLGEWMEQRNYDCLADFRGKLSRERLAGQDRWIYKRTQYVKMLMQAAQELSREIF